MIKIYDMETLEEREILFRGGSGADVSAPVAEILRAVQERGDAALREYTLRFDGAAPDALAVTAEEVDQAAAQVEPAFLAVLEEAAEHIRAYHARQKRESFVMTEREGVVLGQRIIPLALPYQAAEQTGVPHPFSRPVDGLEKGAGDVDDGGKQAASDAVGPRPGDAALPPDEGTDGAVLRLPEKPSLQPVAGPPQGTVGGRVLQAQPQGQEKADKEAVFSNRHKK